MSWGPKGPPTSSRVDIGTSNNVTWIDSFQFDPPGPTGGTYCSPWWAAGVTANQWGFTGQNFRMDIKGNKEQAAPLLSLFSPQMIVVDDPTNRILHTNVPEGVLTGAVTGATGASGAGLIPGQYIYDFIMFDNSSPAVRVALMHGWFTVHDGITGG